MEPVFLNILTCPNIVNEKGHNFDEVCEVNVFTGVCPPGGGGAGVSVSRGDCRGRADVCSGGCLSRGSVPKGGVGSLSKGGVSLSRGISVKGVSVRETPHMATWGRYASYWNALLFSIMLCFFDVKCQRPTECELLLIIVSQ